MELIGRALDELRQRVPPDCELVFCHNDLLQTNLMTDETTLQDVRIIDLEYGSINYAAFDVANHFMEYCGGTEEGERLGCPDYSKLPGEAQKKKFVDIYLEARFGGERSGPENAAGEAASAAFLRDVAIFASVDNIYWGLWGVNQAHTEGMLNFPYLRYGQNRLLRGLQDGGFL
jgi:ethanolamine kinase